MSDTATLAAPPTDKIEFVTPEEAEKFERMLFKNYVRIGKDGKPDKESKKFLFRIIGVHPYEKPGMVTMQNQFLMRFEVQKFHRNKFVTHKVTEGNSKVETKDNEKVDQFKVRADGEGFELNDPEANRFVDCRDFLSEYIQDEE